MAENEGNSHVAALLEDRRWACALARSLVHDEHLADDVVQSAYLATLEHAPPQEVPVRAWFAGVVRNVARMTLRGGARRKARERAASKADDAPSAEALVALAEQHHRLAALVVELEEPYRSAIVQRYFGGLEPSEIAARSNEPAATVRSRIKRGLEKLRARLEEADGSSWRSVLLPLAAGPAALPGAAAIISAAALMKAAALVLLVFTIGATAWRLSTKNGANDAAGNSAATAHHATSDERGATPSASVAAATVLAPRRSADPAAGAVTGRVVDTTGAPVAGAQVIVFPLDIDQTIAAAKPDETGGLARFGFTDASGRFELTPGRASGLVNLWAEHRGFSPAILESRRPTEELVLTLEPGPTMSGSVTDAAGSPVPGARVRWHSVICGVSVDREAVAAADGTYEIADLFADSQSIQTAQPPAAEVVVTAEGHATAYLAPPLPDESGRIRLDAVVTRGSTLTGVVVDATTREPIAGAKIAFWSQREHKTAPGPGARLLPDPMPVKGLSETTADGNGRFRLAGLTSQGRAADRAAAGSPAFGLVGAIAPGYGAAIRTVSIDPKTGSADVVLACASSGRIRGRLVDASGNGLADVPVWLEPRVATHHVLPPILSAERGSLVTRADGTFEFDGVRCEGGESPPLDLVARPSGTLGTPFRKRGIVARAGDVIDLKELNLGGVARLPVLVTDCAGTPIFGARVSLDPFLDQENVEGQSIVTNAAGRGEIRCLEPAPWMGSVLTRVFAQHPGYARGSAFTGKEFVGQDLRIVLNPEHVLRGRICDDGGAPVVGAQVWLIDARWKRDQSFLELEVPSDRLPAHYAAVLTSRAGGKFEVRGLGYNRFHVAARRPDGWSREPVILYDVEAGRAEVVVKLPPVEKILAAGDLEVAISDASTSHPVMDARVVAYTPARGDLVGQQALGVHRFAGLPAGSYTVTVQAHGYVEKIVADVEVAKGASRSLEVRLDRGVTVRGTVTRADGLPFLNARIVFVGDDPVIMPVTHPVAYDGSFAAPDLLPGQQYVVVVTEPGSLGDSVYMLPARGKVALPPDGQELNLRLIAGGVVYFALGNAKSDERELLRGACLIVTNSRGARVCERSSPYKTPLPVSLPPGSYRASIVRGDTVVDEKPFTMNVGETIEVKLALR
jgi:RNA polymerase sigma-70 factor (ECF subfamily)